MKRAKKILSALLCAALLAGLLPGTVLAADHWAKDAVDTLNSIYSTSVFSTDETAMNESDVPPILTTTGWETDKAGSDSDQLTRGTACEVLADVFDLPVPEGKTAIQYLYDQNIINGVSENNLNETGNVSKAEFAVLTYRVLNAVGGGMGSSITLKPGTEEYFAWMYLAARKCVEFEGTEQSGNIDQTTWSSWISRLKSLSTDNAFTSFSPTYPYDTQTVTTLDAAVNIVNQYIQAGGSPTIFSDVPTNSPYYDGVMYLFDQRLISGNGNGTFNPNGSLQRFELAVLLYALDRQSATENRIEAAKTYVATKGYMTPPENADATWWGAPGETIADSAIVTREEAIVAIMMACANESTLNQANTSVLDRFDDTSSLSNDADAAKYIAYAVSIGILNGNAEGNLDLTGNTTRGTIGVLLYRTLIGLDTSKMKDYADSVKYAMPENTPATVSPFSSIAALSSTNPLTLREDWRLTSDLDLEVPEGTTLTIVGNGHHIYEMSGKLLNSGDGTVTFAEGTILYPAAGDKNIENITPEGIWDAKESNALMVLRTKGANDNYYKVTIQQSNGGTITVDKLVAKEGEQVTVTAKPESGYQLGTVTVTDSNNQSTTISNNTFTMPAGDVTITATFKAKPAAPTFSLASGTYTSSQSVTISAAEGATIYYTTDGSEPTTSSSKYTASITISSTTTLKAIAVVAAGTSSEVATATYIIRTGGGGGGGGGGSSTTTETTTNPDGSTTTTVTNNITGTVTETTKNPDGSTEVVQTQKDGTVTTTNTDTEGNKTKVVETPDGTTETTMDRTDGSRSVTTVDENGIVVSETSLTTAAIETAAAAGQPVPLPIPPMTLTEDRTDAPTVTVDLPTDGTTRVLLPVQDVTPGTVAVLVRADGTQEVLKDSLTTEEGVSVPLSDGDTVKLVDNTKTFADVADSYWGADSVTFAASRELFNGTSPTTFSPEAPMTRAMIVTVLARYDGVDTDTGENWYDAGAQWAVDEGISDGTGLDQTLTREQLATMLWRYAGEPVPTASLDAYGDASSVSSYAQQAMAWAVETGLFQGVTPDTLRPQGEAIRAQVATILMRFIDTSA